MIAFGFLLIVLSIIVGARWGDPSGARKNFWDRVSGVLMDGGSLCMLLGVLMWLWKVFP